MGRGWAVGASASLAFSVTQVVLRLREAGPGSRGIDDPIHVLETLAIVLFFAAWSYAIGVGAYGSKGALVALLGYALFGLLVEGVLALAPSWDAHPKLIVAVAVLNFLVGGAAAGGLVREIRERRGPVQWGTALFFLAPIAIIVAVTMAAASVHA